MRCTVVLVVLIQIVYAQWSPMITFISQNQIQNIGGKAELRCSVQDAGLSSVLWTKANGSDILPISVESKLVTNNTRIALHYDQANSTYILEIKDIQQADAGIYRCVLAISVRRKQVAEVELQVQQLPTTTES